jgi:hypothetical protein
MGTRSNMAIQTQRRARRAMKGARTRREARVVRTTAVVPTTVLELVSKSDPSHGKVKSGTFVQSRDPRGNCECALIALQTYVHSFDPNRNIVHERVTEPGADGRPGVRIAAVVLKLSDGTAGRNVTCGALTGAVVTVCRPPRPLKSASILPARG